MRVAAHIACSLITSVCRKKFKQLVVAVHMINIDESVRACAAFVKARQQQYHSRALTKRTPFCAHFKLIAKFQRARRVFNTCSVFFVTFGQVFISATLKEQ